MTEIREGHLGYRETIAFLTIVLSTKLFLTYPRNIILEGQTAGWMIAVVDLLFTLLAVLPILSLLKAYPELTLIEITEKFGGAFSGIIVSLLMFSYFLVITCLVLRQFMETIIAAFLPTTPISILTIFFLIGIIYPCYQGIESMSRGAWLLTPFIVFGTLGVLLLVLQNANIDYLFPFWGAGLPTIIQKGAGTSSLLGEILLITLLNPYLRDRGKVTTILYSSLLVAGSLIIANLVVFLMVFPYPTALTLGDYPLYILARQIYFGRFLQRVEAFFIFIWVFSMLINVSALFYGSAVSLARGLKLPFYRPLLFPLAVLVYGLTFLIPNFPTSVWLNEYHLHHLAWVFSYALPALVWLLATLRSKGGTRNEQPAS